MYLTEIRLLKWMCGKTRKDGIINECFQEHLGVTSIGDKLREIRLRRFGHVQHRPSIAMLRKSFVCAG